MTQQPQIIITITLTSTTATTHVDGKLAVSRERQREPFEDTMGEAVSGVIQLVNDDVFRRWKAGNTSEADLILYPGEDRQGFEDWMQELQYRSKQEKLSEAFIKAYQNVTKMRGFSAHYSATNFIPYHIWENSPYWDKCEQLAQDGLIANGKDDPVWIAYAQAVCGAKLMMYRACDLASVYQQWEKLGLPVLSMAEYHDIQLHNGFEGFEEILRKVVKE